jgi:hypothetical protein
MINTTACASCRRFNRKDVLNDTCEAFPKGIPEEILRGDNNHRNPSIGDRGLRYEPLLGQRG